MRCNSTESESNHRGAKPEKFGSRLLAPSSAKIAIPSSAAVDADSGTGSGVPQHAVQWSVAQFDNVQATGADGEDAVVQNVAGVSPLAAQKLILTLDSIRDGNGLNPSLQYPAMAIHPPEGPPCQPACCPAASKPRRCG